LKRNLFILLALLFFLPGAIVYASSYTGPGNRTTTHTTTTWSGIFEGRRCSQIGGVWAWRVETTCDCANTACVDAAKITYGSYYPGECTAANTSAHGQGVWASTCTSTTTTYTTTYDPVSTSRSLNCVTPGNSGWCRGGLSLTLNASEPIPGQSVIRFDNDSGVICNPANAPSITCTVPISQQGTHASDFWALSTWGDTSLKRAYSWNLDSLAPALTASASGTQNGDWYITDVSLSLSATDATSGIAPSTYRYRINNGAWQSGSSLTLSTDGIHTINAEVQDVAGNTGTRSLTIRLDKTAPTVNPSTSGIQQNGWFRTAVEAAANASDATSGLAWVEHRVNGGAWYPGGLVTVSADGVHSVTFRATDNAGHVTTREVLFSIDNTPPLLIHSLPAPGGENSWHTANVIATLSASDALSGLAPDGLRFRVNDGPWQTGGSLSLDADGLHTIEAQAQDLAGNLRTLSFNVAVDTTPPLLTVSAPEGWRNTGAVATATASDATSGIAAMQHRIAGGAWQNGANRFFEVEGIHEIEFRATDNAGFVTTRSATLQIDLTAPTVIAAPAPDGLDGWFVSHALIPLEALDTLSGVAPGSLEYRQEGQEWTAGEVVSVSQEGIYLIEARASDRAGNIGETSVEVRVDTTPPELEIVVTSEISEHNGWFRAPVTATALAADATSGLSTLSYRVQLADWQEGGSLVLGDGDHQLTMRAADVAGNKTETTRRFRVDGTPPVSTFAIVSGPLSGLVSLSGSSVDETSGIALVEHSLDGGLTWQVLPHTGGRWTMDYDTSSHPDGMHTILVRASDFAGNVELPVALGVMVNNVPPQVSISKSWWIWESGTLLVRPGVAALGVVRLQIICPGLQDVILEFRDLDKMPGEFTWNRRCGEGILAAPGEYQVILTACTNNGRCASDEGLIKIPAGQELEATATPEAVPSAELLPTRPAATPVITPRAVILPNVNEQIYLAPATIHWPLWLVPLAGLLGLVIALGANHVRDPRPRAVEKLADVFARRKDSINHLRRDC
jgi:hypothetical protein